MWKSDAHLKGGDQLPAITMGQRLYTKHNKSTRSVGRFACDALGGSVSLLFSNLIITLIYRTSTEPTFPKIFSSTTQDNFLHIQHGSDECRLCPVFLGALSSEHASFLCWDLIEG